MDTKKYSVADYTKNRVERILIPYLLFALLYILLITPLLGIGEAIHTVSSLWFLYTIFFAQLIYYIISKSKFKRLFFGQLLAITTAIFVGGNLYFERVAYAALFMYCGSIYMEYNNTISKTLGIIITLSALVIFALCNYLIVRNSSALNISYYSGSIFRLPIWILWAVTTSGSYLVIKISKLIISNKFLEYLGRYSLSIYAIHLPIIWQINGIMTTLPHYENTGYKVIYAMCEYGCIFAIVLSIIWVLRKVMPAKYRIYIGIV